MRLNSAPRCPPSRAHSLGAVCVALGLALTSCGGSSPPRPRPGTLRARPSPAPALGGPSCAELHRDGEPRLCAVASLDNENGVMEVRLTLPPDALPNDRHDVRLRFRDHELGPGYLASAVEAIAPPRWPETLGALREPVELHYRVILEPSGIDPAARRGTSWRRPNGWHLTGKSFLPEVWVDGARVPTRATLRLDAGGAPLFSSAGADQSVFDAESLTRLADEAYEAGTLMVTRRDVGATSLHVGASGEVQEGRLEAVADVLARAIAELSARLGPPTTAAVLFTFHPVETEEPWTERLGSSIVHASAELPLDPLYGLGPGPLHELGQLWNPGSHRVEEAWLAEGITDYLALKVAAALAEATPHDTARVILRRYRAYAEAAQGRTLRDTDPARATWTDDAGLIAGFCLDARLRESGGSLDALLRTSLSGDTDVLETGVLLENLAAVSPAAASYLEALVATQGSFGIEDCLERSGLQAREESFVGLADEAVAELLGLSRWSPHRLLQSLEVRSVTEASLLRTGDVVLRVADHPVAELIDVAWALRALSAGERFEIDVRRDGETRTLESTLEVDADRVQRRYVEVQTAEP